MWRAFVKWFGRSQMVEAEVNHKLLLAPSPTYLPWSRMEGGLYVSTLLFIGRPPLTLLLNIVLPLPFLTCHFPTSSCGFVSSLFLLCNLQLIRIMASEVVVADEISFPHQIVTTKPLTLLGHGITDIEIHFLQIKFTAIGVYLESNIVEHLHKWKGKKGSELAEDDEFFEAVIAAPVDKFLRVVVIKEIKGSQYGVQLESTVRDRLAADDKYEEEEETALEKIVEFFQSKYFKKNSIITYHFPAASCTAEIVFSTEGKEDAKIQVENANVVEEIKKWYLGGTRGVSQTTICSLAENLSAKLD